MSKTPEDLRARLFDAIDGVKAGTLDIDKARAINDLSQTIVNLSRVEVDYARATEVKSRFLSADGSTAEPTPPALPNGIKSITHHVCKDD